MSLKSLNVYVPSSISKIPVQSVYGVPSYQTERNVSLCGIIVLFIIGLIVLLNKKIKKKAKIIVLSIIAVAIIVLVLLRKFVFV